MSVKSGNFKIFSDDEVKKIHNSSLEILEETGMWIPEKNCLELLHDAGAKVDFKNKKYYFQHG